MEVSHVQEVAFKKKSILPQWWFYDFFCGVGRVTWEIVKEIFTEKFRGILKYYLKLTTKILKPQLIVPSLVCHTVDGEKFGKISGTHFCCEILFS